MEYMLKTFVRKLVLVNPIHTLFWSVFQAFYSYTENSIYLQSKACLCMQCFSPQYLFWFILLTKVTVLIQTSHHKKCGWVRKSPGFSRQKWVVVQLHRVPMDRHRPFILMGLSLQGINWWTEISFLWWMEGEEEEGDSPISRIPLPKQKLPFRHSHSKKLFLSLHAVKKWRIWENPHHQLPNLG